jgi:hypothetical protein
MYYREIKSDLEELESKVSDNQQFRVLIMRVLHCIASSLDQLAYIAEGKPAKGSKPNRRD